MSQRLLIFSSLSILLFYISYSLSINTQANHLSEILNHLKIDNTFITLIYFCFGMIMIYFIWKLGNYMFARNKYYAQRISINEYEMQKQTYTQVKLNELTNSKEYKEYMNSRQNY